MDDAFLDKKKRMKENGGGNFIIIMHGYTFVGKSTLAQELSNTLGSDLFHSAVIRKELNLSPETKEEANKFFDYRAGLRGDVDRKVYGRLVDNAIRSLKNKRSVILDGAHPFNWQRKNVYNKVIPLGAEVFVLRVVCNEEEEIKRRLKERIERFGSSPFHETPSLNTYIAIKESAENVEEDAFPEGKTLNIIEYDSLIKKTKIIRGDKNSENLKKILHVLAPTKIHIQKRNLEFAEIDEGKILEIIKNKVVIVLDFDGVITNFGKLFVQYLSEFGYDMGEGEVGEGCIEKKKIKEEHYIKARFKAQIGSPNKLPLQKKFLENFSKLRELKNIAIFILTSRYETMLKHLESYMKYYEIKVDGIINTANKSKAESLKSLEADIFVEDNLTKIKEVLNELSDSFVDKCNFIFFRTKENLLQPNLDKRIIELDNWGDLAKIILRRYEKFKEKKKED